MTLPPIIVWGQHLYHFQNLNKKNLVLLLFVIKRATRKSVACDANANKHWLRRREVYLPKGVCFSTKLLPKGVLKGPVTKAEEIRMSR